MMTRPIIGITPARKNDFNNYILNKAYVDVIAAAGGLPLILPYLADEHIAEEIINQIDGLLLSGGYDLDPLTWGEEPLPGVGIIDPERDWFEIALYKQALLNQIPVLGICKGCQLINVAAGGTLYQDLKILEGKVLKHNQDAPRWYPTHSVSVLAESKLFKITGEERFRVNSFHHQAIKDVGEGFVISAQADDEIIEAIEKKDSQFVVAVQWHPETMWPKDEILFSLFQEFVKESSK